MSERETYRHRNGGGHWASAEVIHTFWLGQRVIRSYERRNYIDQIAEEGVVATLPTKRGDSLSVRIADGTEHPWSATEATPYRVWAERNGQRLRNAAKAYTDHLKTVDENGNKLASEDTA
jgi:hypothetical protein